MGFRLPWIRRSSFVAKVTSSKSGEVPKGCLAIYVGEEMRRLVVPLSYLNQPLFLELLNEAEEEFGCDHPKGALTILCTEDVFINVTSSINGC